MWTSLDIQQGQGFSQPLCKPVAEINKPARRVPLQLCSLTGLIQALSLESQAVDGVDGPYLLRFTKYPLQNGQLQLYRWDKAFLLQAYVQ